MKITINKDGSLLVDGENSTHIFSPEMVGYELLDAQNHIKISGGPEDVEHIATNFTIIGKEHHGNSHDHAKATIYNCTFSAAKEKKSWFKRILKLGS